MSDSHGNDAPAKELVRPDEILQSAGEAKEPSLRVVGLYLAAGVGALIALVTVGILLDWLRHAPALPSLPGDPAADAAPLIERYKALNDAAQDRATKLFELLVIKTLLPVFTLIVGYIFGSKREGGGGSMS